MNFNNLVIAFRKARMQLADEGKEAKFVRVTCEQLANIKEHREGWLIESEGGLKFDGLNVVTRGSIRDCNMREARPRVLYIDLTKVE